MSEASDGFSVSHWLEILTTTQTADRQWKEAVKSLTEMGLRAVPVLIEATGDDNPEVRRGASQALHEIGLAMRTTHITSYGSPSLRVRTFRPSLRNASGLKV